MENKKRNLLIFIPTIIFIAAFAVAGILLIVRAVKSENTEKAAAVQSRNEMLFEQRLRGAARRFGIPDDNWRSDIDLEERRRTITIRFPRGRLIEEFVAEIFEATQNSEFKVAEARHIRRGRTQGRRELVLMTFENKRRANEKVFLEIIITNEVLAGTTSAAFLIKNLDRLSPENANALLTFPEPLNYILTPWQTTSDDNRTRTVDNTPQIFRKVLSPVLIEIPIEEKETNEPSTHFARRRYTIRQTDDRRRVNSKINTAVNFFPNAVGFYSRTGNLVLNSRNSSRDFFQALRRRNLAFFDGRPPQSGRNSAAEEVARELGVAFDTITISLPQVLGQNLSENQWETQLRAAVDRAARSRSTVILIAADDNFVPVFVRTLPYIQRRGIEFVPISNF